MRIQVVCTTCGERSNLRPHQITLAAPPPCGEPREGCYGFACSWCGDRVQRPADEHAIGLLEAGGVRRESRQPAATVPPGHPEDPPGGDPFTLDDLIDLHHLLAQAGWYERLASLVEPS